MGIAYGTRTLLAPQIAGLKGGRNLIAQAGLNYFCAGVAGIINCSLMRQKEIRDGIDLENEDGSIKYGKSQIAGKQAIMQTSATRFFMPFPAIFGPALAGGMLMHYKLWPKRLVPAKILELSLVTFSLVVSLPLAIALFEDRCVLPASDLEPQF